MTEYPDVDLHRLAEAMAPLVPEASDWWIPAHDICYPRLNAEIDGVQVRMSLLRVRQTVFGLVPPGLTVIGESPGEWRMNVNSSRIAAEACTRIQTAFTQVMHRWGLLNPWYGKILIGERFVRKMQRWRLARYEERRAILTEVKPRFFGFGEVPLERVLDLRKLLDDYGQWCKNRMRWDRVTRLRGHHQPVLLESVPGQ
jgi:hypothetical protein